MATSEADVAAKLIERLLMDPAFRVRFRRNPAEACREAGLEELAQEMSIGGGKAMMTLDMRESKSSLAGVMMAAAMEGVGVMQFVEHVAPHLDDIPEAIGDVLSRVNLPAIGGALAPSPPPSAPAAPDAAGADGAAGVEPERDAAAAGNGAAPAAAPAAAGEPALAPPAPDAAAPAKAPAGRRRREGRAEDGGGAGGREARQGGGPEDQDRRGGAEGRRGHRRERQGPPERDRPPRRHDRAASPRSTSGASRRPPASPSRRGAAQPPPPIRPPPPRRPPPPPRRPTRQPRRPPPPPTITPPTRPPGAATSRTPRRPRRRGSVDGGGEGAAGEQEPRARRRRPTPTSAPATSTRASIALLTKLTDKHKIELSVMQDRPRQFTSGGSRLQPLRRPRDRHRPVDGEIVRPDSPRRARAGVGARRSCPASYRPDRGRLAVADRGVRVLHRRRPPGPPPRRVRRRGARRTSSSPPPRPRRRRPLLPQRPWPRPRRRLPPPRRSRAPRRPPPPPRAAGAEGGRVRLVPGRDGGRRARRATPVSSSPPSPSSPLPRQRRRRRPVPPTRPPRPPPLSGVSGAYPGDDAPKEQIAAWMARRRRSAGSRPSCRSWPRWSSRGVKNLNFGDADSVGFFQMRVSDLEPGRVRGLPREAGAPGEVVPRPGRARSRSSASRAASPSDDPSQFGEWIADVERPAEQYRGRYQLRLDEAKGLLEQGRRIRARRRRRRRGRSGGRRPGRSRRGRRRRRHVRRRPPPRPVRVRARRHGRQADPGDGGAAQEQEHHLRRDGRRRHQGGQDRPARDRGDDQALRGPQDHGHVHVLGPLARHRGRLDLEPLARPRARHRDDRRRDRAPQLGRRARAGLRALAAAGGLPAERDRQPVRHLGPGLLHRRRPPGPHPLRLQAGDPVGLAPARRRRGRRLRGRPRRGRPPRRRPAPPCPLRPRAPVAAAAAAPAPPKAGESGQFLAAKAADPDEGRLGFVHGRQARRARERAGAARDGPRRGRRRRRRGAGVGLEHPRRGGPEDRGEPARRQGGRHQHRRQGRRVPQGGGRRRPATRGARAS